jgi:hypothetical protein
MASGSLSGSGAGRAAARRSWISTSLARWSVGQLVQDDALVESGSLDIGEDVGFDLLPARKVALDGAAVDAEGFGGLFRVGRTLRQLVV